MKLRYVIPILCALTLSSCDSVDEQEPTVDEAFASEISIETIAQGFIIPWGIEVISEDEFLFTERLGRIYHFKNGRVNPLGNVPRSATVEFAGLTYGGIMDISLHPQFETNRMVYIAYVHSTSRMAVARFNFANETVEDLEVVFNSNAFSIGSRIAWEDDSHFFVTQGLGGNPFPEPGPQDLWSHGGKIHRLMADGTIPSDNPIFNGFEVPTSVWSYGHRDPQGLYYDDETKTLYSHEHGPLGGDEFNIIRKGGNYGWPLFSYGLNYDRSPVSDMTEAEAREQTVLPIKHWDSEFNLAPSGLTQLTGSLFSKWNGWFIMGSLPQQRLVAYNMATDETNVLVHGIGRVRDVAQLPSGNLLILVDSGSPRHTDSGRILKLSPK